MEYYIVFFCMCFLIDFVKVLTLKRVFKLSSKNIELLFLQIINLSVSAIYLFYKIRFYQFLLLKILIDFVIILLITDSYKFGRLISLFSTSIILMFSYYGFSKFIIELARAIIIELFSINLPHFLDLVIIFSIICYIIAVFVIIHKLSKRKNLESFLKRVSFLAFGKHIELIGLLDTGNVLYDNKTGLPVILISAFSLKKYLPEITYKNITNGNYLDLAIDNYLKVITVSDKLAEVPIIEINNATISDDEKSKIFNCVIGIVNHKFENKNFYDCLIHRDFV